jgi:DNA-binding SARP family transcriptional activator
MLRANGSVECSWLAGIFWPESREAQALNNLRRNLSNLRQVLGDEAYRLVSPTPQTIAFDLADTFCDVTASDTALALLARDGRAGLCRRFMAAMGSAW